MLKEEADRLFHHLALLEALGEERRARQKAADAERMRRWKQRDRRRRAQWRAGIFPSLAESDFDDLDGEEEAVETIDIETDGRAHLLLF